MCFYFIFYNLQNPNPSLDTQTMQSRIIPQILGDALLCFIATMSGKHFMKYFFLNALEIDVVFPSLSNIGLVNYSVKELCNTSSIFCCGTSETTEEFC